MGTISKATRAWQRQQLQRELAWEARYLKFFEEADDPKLAAAVRVLNLIAHLRNLSQHGYFDYDLLHYALETYQQEANLEAYSNPMGGTLYRFKT